MNLFHRSELKTLLAQRQGPCVSIYMPTVRGGDQVRQNPIRFRNLLREAQERLTRFGLADTEIRQILDPVDNLGEQSPFWMQQKDGLAIFLAPGFHRWYQVPMAFHERVEVGETFQLKQILRLLSEDHRFLLLTLALQNVCLYEVSREGIDRVDIPLPQGLDDYLKNQGVEVEEIKPQRKSSGPVDRGPGMGATRMVSTDPHDRERERIKEFMRAVAEGLAPVLTHDRTPLLLAGVEYLHPIFREVCHSPALVPGGIRGNVDEVPLGELHKQAWRHMGATFRERQEQAEARFMELLGTGLASNHLERIVAAACQGRVETLFVPVGVQTWGRWIPEEARVELDSNGRHDGSTDLLNLSATQTLMTGGEVVAVQPDQVPGEGTLAAVFRY